LLQHAERAHADQHASPLALQALRVFDTSRLDRLAPCLAAGLLDRLGGVARAVCNLLQ
jgi:hypothetical protein